MVAYWEEVISGRRWKDTWEDNPRIFYRRSCKLARKFVPRIAYPDPTESASRPDLDVEQPDSKIIGKYPF